MPSSRKDDLIVMSCDEDKEMCKKAHIQTAYTAELLLTGILRQELDLEQYVKPSCQKILYPWLFMKRTSSSKSVVSWQWSSQYQNALASLALT